MRVLLLLLFSLCFLTKLIFGQSSIVVSTSADNGQGSLRQAITDIDVGGTISFAVPFVLLDTTLVIDKNLIIDGGPQELTIATSNDWRGPGGNIYYTNPLFELDGSHVVFGSVRLYNQFLVNLIETKNNSQLELNDANLACWTTCISQDGGEAHLTDTDVGVYTGSPTFNFNQTDAVSFTNVELRYDDSPLGDRGGGLEINAGDVLIENSDFGSEINNRGASLTIRNSSFGSAWAFNRGVRALANFRGNYKIIRSTADGLGISQSSGNGEILDSIVRPGPYYYGTTTALTYIVSDPELGPFVNLLLDFGMIPLASSPVVDQGDCSFTGSTLDRQGQDRPVDLPRPINARGGDSCDIGAIELESDNRIENNLSAKIILAGAWDGSEMKTDLLRSGYLPLQQPYQGAQPLEVDQSFLDAHPEIVDWVYLELRTTPSRQVLGSRQAVFVTSTGDLMSISGEIPKILNSPGQYYVVVGHRNHLPIMSASTLDFASPDQDLLLDLTSDASSIYTNGSLTSAPIVDLGSVLGMWSGDVSGNAEIKYSGSGNDRVLILDQAGGPSPFDFVNGYLSGDVNLDGKVSYAGAQNDRVEVLEGAGGPTAFDSRKSHVPGL